MPKSTISTIQLFDMFPEQPSAPVPMPNQNPREPFPAWRLPDGTINASDGDLEFSIESCELWEWWAGGLVVIGLIAAVGIAGYHPSYDSFWERWGSVVADSLVAIGVVAEIKFGQMAGLRQHELAKRSKERVANAELETEKLRKASAWRALSVEQHTALAEALRSSGPKASVRFCLVMNEQESLSFAYKLSHPFRAAGWAVGFQFDTYAHDIMAGILLPESNASWLQSGAALSKRVRQSFVDADISFVNGWPLSSNLTTTDNAVLLAPIAFVYVGPKPAPML